MGNKLFLCLLPAIIVSAVHGSVFTLSDRGLMSLDYTDAEGTAKVVAVRDVPGPGVEFDIRYPSKKFPGNNIHYLSGRSGGAGKLAGLELTDHDSFGLSFTLVSVDGVKEPPIGGKLVVGALVFTPSMNYSYRPQSVSLMSSGKNKSTSITDVRENGVGGLGFETHFLTDAVEWNDGTTLTLLIEPMSGAIQLPDHFDRAHVSKADSDVSRGPKPSGTDSKTLILDLGGWVKMKMALIPAGEFLMGSPTSERDRGLTEGPQHRVQISKPFYIGKHEVTQTQWEAVMGNDPSHFKGYGFPVEQVSWEDCRLFCDKLSEKTGKTVRLPTEAEWEYACRAGTTTRFSCGDDEMELRQHAWMDDNSEGTTHKSGSKQPNPWGLYDMHGNVWEWCGDWYGEKYYSELPAADPTGPVNGLYRVVRGGSWDDRERTYMRCAYRNYHAPNRKHDSYGFRVVVLSPDTGSVPAASLKPLEQTRRAEPSSRPESIGSISETITIYDNARIPAGIGISTGRYTKVDGYRYVNIAVEFEQKAPDEAPLSLGVVFAHDENGRMGSRRYFTFEENFTGAANPQMITVSGKDCWSGHPHDTSRYLARFPIMGPYIQVFPFNYHGEPRKFSVVLYLTR